ncbi:glycosyltransferase family 61 protein [Haloarchaeobius baliensis]|uniref:glycosyltransferase family 61 protein n=1 Tax=Haloarchaeobius baliensis TaxID=1670458 RepID=UPI003F8847D1
MLAGAHPAVTASSSYGTQETTRFEEPVHVGVLPETIADRPVEWTSADAAICAVTDAQLVGPDGLTLLPDGTVVMENSLGWSLRVLLGAGRAAKERTRPTYRSGMADRRLDEAVSLVGAWTDNYYHWFVDYLSRLQTVERYSEETDRRPTLIVPPEFGGWRAEALSFFGYDESDWVEFGGGRLHVDRLLVPTLRRDVEETAPDVQDLTYTAAPSALRWLGEGGLAAAAATDPDPSYDRPDRLYVSRENTPMRRVVNRNALEMVLDEYGVRVVKPEERSVTEQVRLFRDAEVVVAPHGAGLTNLVFGSELTVVSLFGDDHHPVYYAMAEQLDHEFACLVCEADGEDLRVDPDRLRELFDAVGL